ncbi:hypothetical protein C8R47DRAFT_1084626 [Mycena vitilis]|nr:hypothetical protein C8R47DRAFT_1084626 [Mycena vitilis]
MSVNQDVKFCRTSTIRSMENVTNYHALAIILEYPDNTSRESFILWAPKSDNPKYHDPIADLVKALKIIVDYTDLAYFSLPDIMQSQGFKIRVQAEFVLDGCSACAWTSTAIPKDILLHLLHETYSRSVEWDNKLNIYAPFSAEVYGKLSTTLFYNMVQLTTLFYNMVQLTLLVVGNTIFTALSTGNMTISYKA